MARFVFKLASVKKHRAELLLLAQKEVIRIETQVADLVDAQRRAILERREAIEKSHLGSTSLGIALLNSDLVATEGERITRLEREIQTMEQELERQRRWFAQRGQELKAIEKLEEKQRAAFDADIRLREMRSNDQWVAERWKGSAE